MTEPPENEKPEEETKPDKRRWYQFSLSALLLFVLFSSVLTVTIVIVTRRYFIVSKYEDSSNHLNSWTLRFEQAFTNNNCNNCRVLVFTKYFVGIESKTERIVVTDSEYRELFSALIGNGTTAEAVNIETKNDWIVLTISGIHYRDPNQTRGTYSYRLTTTGIEEID